MIHQCYYCEQIFESKEKLYDHLDVHSKPERTQIKSRKKNYPIICSDCGKDSEVPFQPKTDRPVYCRECLPKHRTSIKQKLRV